MKHFPSPFLFSSSLVFVIHSRVDSVHKFLFLYVTVCMGGFSPFKFFRRQIQVFLFQSNSSPQIQKRKKHKSVMLLRFISLIWLNLPSPAESPWAPKAEYFPMMIKDKNGQCKQKDNYRLVCTINYD